MHPSHGRYYQQQPACTQSTYAIAPEVGNPTVYPTLSSSAIHYRYTTAASATSYGGGHLDPQASYSNVPFNQDRTNQNSNTSFQINTGYPQNQYIGNYNQPLPPSRTFAQTNPFDELRDEIAEFVGLIELKHSKTRTQPMCPPPSCSQKVQPIPSTSYKSRQPMQSPGINQCNYTYAESTCSSSSSSPQVHSFTAPNYTPNIRQTTTSSVSVIQSTGASPDPTLTSSPVQYFEVSRAKNRFPVTSNKPAFTQEFYDFIKSPQVVQTPEIRDEPTSPGFWVCDPEIWRKEQERMSGSSSTEKTLAEQPSCSGTRADRPKKVNTIDSVLKKDAGIPIIDLTEDDSPSDDEQAREKSLDFTDTLQNGSALHSYTRDSGNQTRSPFPSELPHFSQNDDSPKSSSHSNETAMESMEHCSSASNSLGDSSTQGSSTHSNDSELGTIDSCSLQEHSPTSNESVVEPMYDDGPQEHSMDNSIASHTDTIVEDMPKIIACYSLNPEVKIKQMSFVDNYRFFEREVGEPATSKLNERARRLLQNLSHAAGKEKNVSSKSRKTVEHRPQPHTSTNVVSVEDTEAIRSPQNEVGKPVSPKSNKEARKSKQNVAKTHTRKKEKIASPRSRKARKHPTLRGTPDLTEETASRHVEVGEPPESNMQTRTIVQNVDDIVRKKKKVLPKSRKSRKKQASPGAPKVSRRTSHHQTPLENASESTSSTSSRRGHIEKVEELLGSDTAGYVDAWLKNPNSPGLKQKILRILMSPEKHGSAPSPEPSAPPTQNSSVIVNNTNPIQPMQTSACGTQGERITTHKSQDVDQGSSNELSANYDEITSEIIDYSMKHLRTANENEKSGEIDSTQSQEIPLDLSLSKGTGDKDEQVYTVTEVTTTPSNVILNPSISTRSTIESMSTAAALSDASCKTSSATALEDTFVSSETNSYFENVQEMSNEEIENAVSKTGVNFDTTHDNVYDDDISIEASLTALQEFETAGTEENALQEIDSVKTGESVIKITHTIVDDTANVTSTLGKSGFECSSANTVIASPKTIVTAVNICEQLPDIKEEENIDNTVTLKSSSETLNCPDEESGLFIEDNPQEVEKVPADSRDTTIPIIHSSLNSSKEQLDTGKFSRSTQNEKDREKEQIYNHHPDIIVTDTDDDTRLEDPSANKILAGKQTVIHAVNICEQLPEVKEEEYGDNITTLTSSSESQNIFNEEPDIFVIDDSPEYVQEPVDSRDIPDDQFEVDSPEICDIFKDSEASSESQGLSNDTFSDENAAASLTRNNASLTTVPIEPESDSFGENNAMALIETEPSSFDMMADNLKHSSALIEPESNSIEDEEEAMIDTDSSSSGCNIFVDGTPPTTLDIGASNGISYPESEEENNQFHTLGGTTLEYRSPSENESGDKPTPIDHSKIAELSSPTSPCLESAESSPDIEEMWKNSCDIAVVNDGVKLQKKLLDEEEPLLVVVVDDSELPDTLMSEKSAEFERNASCTVHSPQNVASIVENIPNDDSTSDTMNSAAAIGYEVDAGKAEHLEEDSDTPFSEKSLELNTNESSTVHSWENDSSSVENVPKEGIESNDTNPAGTSRCGVDEGKVELIADDNRTPSVTQIEIHVDGFDVVSCPSGSGQDPLEIKETCSEDRGNVYSNEIIPKIEENICEDTAALFQSIETEHDGSVVRARNYCRSPTAVENTDKTPSTSEDTENIPEDYTKIPSDATVCWEDEKSTSEDPIQTSTSEATQTDEVELSEHCKEPNTEKRFDILRRSISSDHDYLKQPTTVIQTTVIQDALSPIFDDIPIETISLLTSSEDEAEDSLQTKEGMGNMDDMRISTPLKLHKKYRKRKSINDCYKSNDGSPKNKTARMGNWRSSSVPVFPEVIHQPLPYHEKARNAQVARNVPVLDVMLGIGVVFKEQSEDVLSDESTLPIPHESSEAFENSQDKQRLQDFHLKPCCVQLDRLDIPI